MSNFGINPSSVQGLGLSLRSGDCSVEKDLALVQSRSGKWSLIDLRKEATPTEGAVIRGKELVDLMKAVANGEKALPPLATSALNEKEYQNLTRDTKFSTLCRLVPGMETPEHAQSRERRTQALNRSVETAKVVGKGLNEIEKQGLEGRYVGQGQEDQSYWIKEVLYRDSPRPAGEVDVLTFTWKEDKTSNLPLKSWESAKRQEWETLKPSQDFLPWLKAETWSKKELAAWEKEHPGQTFNAKEFSDWQLNQKDPDLQFPTWILKEFSGTDNDADYQAWKKNVVVDRKEVWEKFKVETGTNLTFEEHEQLDYKYMLSSSESNLERWMMQQLWEQAKSDPVAPTSDDFVTFVRRQKFHQENPGVTSKAEFNKWIDTQEQALHTRYEGSKLPISFEEWKAQQNDSILTETSPFILLGDREREIYHTTCNAGTLERNGFPFNTQFEKTRHSGEGYAIFVIAPDKNMYCGSHIGGVFHHSSFLGEAATVAAGEVKTNPDGSIAALSSKSGHYQPVDAQNLYMLRYFRDRGVDLSTIKFTSYGKEGKTVERNALEYLQELEHQEALGKIDLSLFE